MGITRLRDLLRTNPEVRKLYVDRQMFGAILKLDGDAGIGSPDTGHGGIETAVFSMSDRDRLLPCADSENAVNVPTVLHATKHSVEGVTVVTRVSCSLLLHRFCFVLCWDAGCLSSHACSLRSR